ncbi:radical SAM family heme chaperone HemW [Aureitalea marina]|uniref:Heme chaperone HemW n=1 Tax=Aureitalea marina TaxID=930804 RepID=A0A2S7KLL1_9FLAO|nr:radical SAM family heme chaperone HemW [Aureitalea marina]PQB03470.1 coproporphyrinogen III oxidase [Aureitalea marina]
MSGIYLHIPFCKQACHYCDFHFSTSLKKKSELIEAMRREIVLRKKELNGPLETIYFGGGTPSLLDEDELNTILSQIRDQFETIDDPEITLEANPDDITEDKLIAWRRAGVNRLSIGIQSFFEEDLKWMNRAHNAEEAFHCIELAKPYFDNISVDLIYGVPGMGMDRWKENLQRFLGLDVPHISCYALTVEQGTALDYFIRKGKVRPPEDELADAHYQLMLDELQEEGYENYEFSNFGKPGYFSRNNLGYWMGKPYLGIGPSAHSYDGSSRSWNVANNVNYIQSLQKGELPLERELLTKVDRFNEMVMTRLRTQFGLNLEEVAHEFGVQIKDHLMEMAGPLLQEGMMETKGDILQVTRKGKFLTDGISSRLFLLNLGD